MHAIRLPHTQGKASITFEEHIKLTQYQVDMILYAYMDPVCVQACQSTGANYGIGSLSTVSCNTSETDPSTNKWNIILSYTGGADTRQSQFTFMYSPSDATPEMTFDKEQPELHYVSSTLRRIHTYT